MDQQLRWILQQEVLHSVIVLRVPESDNSRALHHSRDLFPRNGVDQGSKQVRRVNFLLPGDDFPDFGVLHGHVVDMHSHQLH